MDNNIPLSLGGVSASVHIGRHAGSLLWEELLAAEQNIKVVSPFVSAEFMDALLEKAEEGVAVTLVTCDMGKTEDDPAAHRATVRKILRQDRYINKKEVKKRLFLRLFYLAVILSNLAVLAYGIHGFAVAASIGLTQFLIVCAIGAALFITALVAARVLKGIDIYLYDYVPLINFKIFKGRKNGALHAKIYCIDERAAYLGSLNFTKNGLKSHYETAVRIGSPEVVADISASILDLYDDGEREFYTPEELGRLYFEN